MDEPSSERVGSVDSFRVGCSLNHSRRILCWLHLREEDERALPCRLVIAPKAPLNRLHVHAHVHRHVSRKPNINQNDQSAIECSLLRLQLINFRARGSSPKCPSCPLSRWHDKINGRPGYLKKNGRTEFLNKITRRRLQGSYKADKEKVVLIKFCEDYSGVTWPEDLGHGPITPLNNCPKLRVAPLTSNVGVLTRFRFLGPNNSAGLCRELRTVAGGRSKDRAFEIMIYRVIPDEPHYSLPLSFSDQSGLYHTGVIVTTTWRANRSGRYRANLSCNVEASGFSTGFRREGPRVYHRSRYFHIDANQVTSRRVAELTPAFRLLPNYAVKNVVRQGKPHSSIFVAKIRFFRAGCFANLVENIIGRRTILSTCPCPPTSKVLEDYYSRSIIQFRVKRNDRGSRKRTSPEIRTRKRTKGDFPPPPQSSPPPAPFLPLRIVLENFIRSTTRTMTCNVENENNFFSNFLPLLKNHALRAPRINAERHLGKTFGPSLFLFTPFPVIVTKTEKNGAARNCDLAMWPREIFTWWLALLVSTPRALSPMCDKNRNRILLAKLPILSVILVESHRVARRIGRTNVRLYYLLGRVTVPCTRVPGDGIFFFPGQRNNAGRRKTMAIAGDYRSHALDVTDPLHFLTPRRSIDYVHRPGPRRYFRAPLDERNIARALHIHFLESHFMHYLPDKFRSQRRNILMLANGARSPVRIYDPPQDGALRGFIISRGKRTPGSRTSGRPRRETAQNDGTGGWNVLDVRSTRRADEREKERQREREKEGGTSARRLGTRVRRPTEARFGCQSTPHPKLDSSSSNESAVSVGSPSGTRGGSGVAEGGTRTSAARLRQVNRPDDGIPLHSLPATRYSLVLRCTAEARRERKD
ncbi:hypothetical protein DBV15_04228 [Temnothorax longispinosus]|uniref:Uncharacterized protein n=1 Tax=Temnothorax longispinosus TaxID=300112 RepID=A0A4S2KLG2_9HYME|nr:hypothetical protein DBV15_04228 [Temnothorax longispinosus]